MTAALGRDRVPPPALRPPGPGDGGAARGAGVRRGPGRAAHPGVGITENFGASGAGTHAKQAPADATKMAIPTTFLTVLRHLGYDEIVGSRLVTVKPGCYGSAVTTTGAVVMSTRKRVVIVGAGFGGLAAAKALGSPTTGARSRSPSSIA